MKRKEFIKRTVFSCGALALGMGCMRRVTEESEPEALLSQAGEFVMEPVRRIPVLVNTDVVVIGGGPAGVAAAIAAAGVGPKPIWWNDTTI